MTTMDSLQSKPGRPENRVRKPGRASAVAKLNAKVFNGLRRALQDNPELDISSVINAKYSQTFESFKSVKDTGFPVSPRTDDLRSEIDPADPANIIYKLSPDLQSKLGNYKNLSTAIIDILATGEVLCQEPSVTVIQLGTIAAKIVRGDQVITEHASLEYLEEHLPNFPAPKPHGLIKIGAYYLLFTTCLSGVTLEEAWPRLNVEEKSSVRDQLEDLLSQLRSLPLPDSTALGSVTGDGCKDRRRMLRTNSQPIMNTKQFEDFIFSGSKSASPQYIRILQSLMPGHTSCVFTHGDLRPANIMVQMKGMCTVLGIIDWEASGFYPAYWESIKATNNLTSGESFDWYNYLPDSASPHTHSVAWLVDRVWDRSMVNS